MREKLSSLLSWIIKIYKKNINYSNYAINRNKVKKYAKESIKYIPVNNVTLKYEEKIEAFRHTLKENMPYVDLSYFDRNLSDLVITEKRISDNITGRYNVGLNIIELLNEDSGDSITHELLHLSSAFYNNNMRFCGFRQSDDEIDIGRGLNEGYTSLLDDRYFLEDCSKIYYLLMIISSCIEEIVGKENMEKMYFDANLYGLIEELKKFVDEDAVYDLIKNIDFLYYKFTVNHIPSEEETKYIESTCGKISAILLKCYFVKLLKTSKEIPMTNEEFNELLKRYTNKLAVNICINDARVNFLTQEIYDYVSEEMLLLNDNLTLVNDSKKMI